jgi:NAD(P)-dependent dehydrogenase (short-subunit alcohol dehydrogenase family)
MRVCIVGASGKLGQCMVQHALDRGYEVVGVCREQSVEKLDAYKGRITVIPGATNDPKVIKRAVAGCDGVLVVLVPRGVNQYASGTVQAVLDDARPGAHLVFSCGWHITRDGQDVYSWKLKALVKVGGRLARLARFADLDDQVEACRRVFASDTGGPSCAARPRGGREPGPARVEPARGRPHPQEQPHAPRGLRPVHGGGPRERRARPRGPGDCRLPNALGARARRQVMNASMRDAMPRTRAIRSLGDTLCEAPRRLSSVPQSLKQVSRARDPSDLLLASEPGKRTAARLLLGPPKPHSSSLSAFAATGRMLKASRGGVRAAPTRLQHRLPAVKVGPCRPAPPARP